MKSNLLFVLLFTWLAGLSGFVGYLGYVTLRSNDTTVVTTNRLNTIASTLQTVQTDVSALNTTTNNTLQSTTISYGNSDLNLWIEASGSTQYKGYMFLNDTGNVNISDTVPNDTVNACGCNQYSFIQMRNLSPISPERVYVSEDMTIFCQYSTGSGYSSCVKIDQPCRQLIILIVPYPDGQSTTVKINRSYGSVCV